MNELKGKGGGRRLCMLIVFSSFYCSSHQGSLLLIETRFEVKDYGLDGKMYEKQYKPNAQDRCSLFLFLYMFFHIVSNNNY